jgi:signal transduction histidine kinase
MSYRAFKKLLGETSLERKCRFLLGTGSLVLITSSFLFYSLQTERAAKKTTSKSGALLIGQILTSLHDEKLESRTALDQFQKQAEERWPTALKGYASQIIKPYARSAVHQTDPMMPDEAALIKEFVRNPGKQEETLFPADGDSIYYYGAVRAVPLCLNCHPRTPEERADLGDLVEDSLMAVIRVRFSTQAIEEDFHLNRAIMISVALVTSVLIMAGTYLIVRYVVVKPVKHLKEVSDAIAAGEVNVRSEIQTGDEFEDLSYAFNRMLRNLMSKEDELKHANIDLDRKLDELARANMALYESNRLKSDFLATMSHELRTPLNSILGFSDLLLANPQLSDKLRRWAGNIQMSGKQLLTLINDLLDLAKIEAGKMEVRPESLDVSESVDGLLTMFRPLAEKKNIELRASYATDLPLVEQDAGKLRQILSNLLSNAIKFTPEGGRVSLRADVDGSELVLTVSDTGVGIAPEDQDAVFDKFRQAANPLTREHDGTGLGLSIVRELAKLLGGDVTLKSELGRGSTFTVRLPLRMRRAPKLAYLPPAGILGDGPDGVAATTAATIRE